MTGRARPTLAAGVIAALLAAPAAADAGRWSFGAEAGVGWDSNVTNAEWEGDIFDAGFADLMVSAQRSQPLGAESQLQLRGMVQAEAWQRFDGLSHQRAALGARVLHRVGDDFFAPTLVVGATVDVADFDSEMRDSTGARATVSALQQLTTAVRARAGLGASWRDADSEVFDLNSKTVGGHVEWTVGPQLLLDFGYDFHEGRIVSTGRPRFGLVRSAEAIEPDDAFGGLAADRFAYRIRAQTHAGTLGATVALSRNLSLDTRLQYFNVGTAGGARYQRWVGLGSLLARF